MAELQGSWIWYELITPDPERSRAFYEPLVGWSISTGHGENDEYGFITAPDGAMVGGVLRLDPDRIAHGARPSWVGYLGVVDCDAAVRQLAEAGGKVLMPPHDVEMAGRVAMVADPGGAPFYLITPIPRPEGGESTAFRAHKLHGHCGWNELMAGDAARETAFYTALFGWSLPDAMDMGEMGKYQFIAQQEVTIGAIMQAPPQVPLPMWNHYFWVPSIGATIAQIEAGGGKVINGPMEVPGGDWIVQGLDSLGVGFCLVGGH